MIELDKYLVPNIGAISLTIVIAILAVCLLSGPKKCNKENAKPNSADQVQEIKTHTKKYLD